MKKNSKKDPTPKLETLKTLQEKQATEIKGGSTPRWGIS